MHRVGVLGFALAATAAISGQSQSLDLIIRNGTVIDGGGTPRFDADVGIKGSGTVAVNVGGAPRMRGSPPLTAVTITTR